MSEKWRQSEIGIVINDKSQGRTAKHLKNDEIVYYTFIIQSVGERIFLNWWTFGEVTGMRPICIEFLSAKMLISPDKLNNLCIIDRNRY